MWLDALRQDIRYAMRTFMRSPLFALTAIVSIAIGIAADTTIFSVANALLLRPPAGVRAHDTLVAISAMDGDRFGVNEVSFPNFSDLRARATTLSDFYGYEPVAQPMSLAVNDRVERVFGHRVTPNYFAALGVGAEAGRLLDVAAANTDAVVLSHGFWVRRFARDPAIVGATVSINSRRATIVGVAAEGFTGTSLIVADLWTPLDTVPFDGSFLTRRELGWALVGARLNPGVSRAQAAAEVDAIAIALGREYPDTNAGRGFQLAGASLIPGNLSVPLSGVLTLLLAFVSLVLVIACANLAGLLLTRAVTRRREIAVRVAIGAGGARLIRQLLTEVTVLFAAGGFLGAALAYALTATIEKMLLPALPIPLGISLTLDTRVLLFTTGLSLLAALVCGLIPARQSSRADVVSALKDEAQATPRRMRLRHAFVVCQVAGSVVLVAATMVFVRALEKATAIDPGYDPHGVELATLDLSLAGYNATTGPRLLRELTERVRALGGVEVASVAASLPTGGTLRVGILTHPGVQPGRGAETLHADWNAVETQYFRTMRIPIVRGRDFADADAEGATGVAIVSEEAARRYWPGQDAIGKYLLQHPAIFRRGEANAPRTLLVIGVAGNVTAPTRDVPRAHVYVPLQQQYLSGVSLVVRSAHAGRPTREIEQAIRSVDPNLPIINSDTLENAVAFALLPQRVAAAVSASLGLVGLLLAAMGIYGVAAFAVAQRTREIGIRIALGAERRAVIRLVLENAVVLSVAGCAAGVTTVAMTHLTLTRASFGFPAFDPIALLIAIVIFVTAAIVATYVPVRRALALDPIVTLRYE